LQYQASSSPTRKRQRLSSSTYDDKVDLNAFDKIEKPRFELSTMGFVSATKLPIQDDYRSPSPEGTPPEPDIDAWFNPAPLEALPLFTTAKSIDKADAYRSKAFRSPLVKNMHTSKGDQLPHPLSASVNASPGFASTPHTGFASSSSFMSPLRPSGPQTGFASPSSFMSPLRPTVPQTGFASSSSFITPVRSSVRPNGTRTRPAPFVTPFKTGMRPGDPGRSKQSQSSVATTSPLALKAPSKKETPQKRSIKDKPACVLQRKGFFSLGWCTNYSHLCR
jgi:hypothetical protein